MGSRSDWEVMENCSKQLDELQVPHEAFALSAHRTPDAVIEYCNTAISPRGDWRRARTSARLAGVSVTSNDFTVARPPKNDCASIAPV